MDNAILAQALRTLHRFPNGRCSAAYLQHILGFGDNGDKPIIAIRDELTHMGMVGWSWPPKGPRELFLTKAGRVFMENPSQTLEENATA